MINDAEVCGDKGYDGASCFHTISNSSRDLSKPVWDQVRFGQLCMDSSEYLHLKAAIEKLCHTTNDCDYQAQQQLQILFSRIEKFRAQIR